MVRITKPPSRGGNVLLGGALANQIPGTWQNPTQQYEAMLAAKRSQETSYRRNQDYLAPSLYGFNNNPASMPFQYEMISPQSQFLTSSYRPLQRTTSIPVNMGNAGIWNNPYTDIISVSEKAKNAAYRDDLQRQVEEKRLQRQLDQMEEQRENQRIAREALAYDPFGRGGGGAPMQDSNGRLIADRRELNRSWDQGPRSKEDPIIIFRENPRQRASSWGGNPYSREMNSIGAGGGSDYKSELLRQIEEKKRQRELEEQREREIEARERLKFEQHLARQKEEELQERLRYAEKQQELQKREDIVRKEQENLQLQLKQAKLAKFDAPAQDDGLEWWEKRPPVTKQKPVLAASIINKGAAETNTNNKDIAADKREAVAARQSSTTTRPILHEPAAVLNPVTSPPPVHPVERRISPPKADILIVRHDTPQLPSSPVERSGQVKSAAQSSIRQLEAISSQLPLGDENVRSNSTPDFRLGDFTSSLLARPKHSPELFRDRRSHSPDFQGNRRNLYPLRSAAVRNEITLRQISAMREKLQKEQYRVNSALRRKDYGEHLFDDDEDVILPRQFHSYVDSSSIHATKPPRNRHEANSAPTVRQLLQSAHQREERRRQSLISNSSLQLEFQDTKLRRNSTYSPLLPWHSVSGLRQVGSGHRADEPNELVELIQQSRTRFSSLPSTAARDASRYHNHKQHAEAGHHNARPNSTKSDNDSILDRIIKSYALD